MELKFVSFNVNGLRAIVKKNFLEDFATLDADFFCLQETKLQEGQIDLEFPGYTSYWNYAEKKGYSGTAIFTKHKPLSVQKGIGIEEFDQEGRVLALEYDHFWLVNVYVPNSQPKLARVEYRMEWEDAFRNFLKKLEEDKAVIVCGDLNVAHTEIDLKNPQSNHKSPGFSDQERGKFSTLLDHGFIDTFRFFYPDLTEKYTWWSYRFSARKTNAGWRIDYFLVSEKLKDQLVSAKIHDDILGSDHCPVSLTISQ